MKARQEDNLIKVYTSNQFKVLFNYYNNTHLWYLSPKNILEKEGFYDVIKPVINENEILSPIQFDKINKIFTYTILPKDVIQIKIDKRNNLLKVGVTISTSTDNFWFNEVYLNSFINAISLHEKNSLPIIDWKNLNKDWVKITLFDANEIALKAMNSIKEIYKMI